MPKIIPIINIDHHQDSTYFGRINIVKGNTSSTAEIKFEIIEKVGIPINKEIATCLLIGIFGDTDSFKNPTVNYKTLKATSELLKYGVNLKEITPYTFQDKSLATLKLWGKVLTNLKKNRKFNIISVIIKEEDIIDAKASYEDLEGISNFINCTPGIYASMVIIEKGGKIKGSLRTLKDSVDVSKIAHLFGGGGHKKAAGFTIAGRVSQNGQGWKVE